MNEPKSKCSGVDRNGKLCRKSHAPAPREKRERKCGHGLSPNDVRGHLTPEYAAKEPDFVCTKLPQTPQEKSEEKSYLKKMSENGHESSGKSNFDGMICKHCGATSRVPGWDEKCLRSISTPQESEGWEREFDEAKKGWWLRFRYEVKGRTVEVEGFDEIDKKVKDFIRAKIAEAEERVAERGNETTRQAIQVARIATRSQTLEEVEKDYIEWVLVSSYQEKYTGKTPFREWKTKAEVKDMQNWT